MADLSVVATLRIIEVHEPLLSLPADEAITIGKAARFNASGYYTTANGTAAGEANTVGLNTSYKTNQANMVAAVLRRGLALLLDSAGANILAGLAYGDPVYLSDTDGRLSSTVGTVTVQIGTVVPLMDQGTPTKVLRVAL